MILIYGVFLGVYIVVTRILYKYKIDRTVLGLILLLGGMLILCYAFSMIPNVYISYGVMTLIVIISSIYSIRELDNRMAIISLIKSKLNGHVK